MNTIASLTPRHLKIVDLAVKGWTEKQIAEFLGMGKQQVSIIFNSPTFKHEFAIRRSIFEEKMDKEQSDKEDEVAKLLKEGAIKAARTLVGHIDSADDSISVRSSTEILDRTGYSKKADKQIEVLGPTIVINNKDATRIIESIKLDNDDAETVSEPAKSTESSELPLSTFDPEEKSAH